MLFTPPYLMCVLAITPSVYPPLKFAPQHISPQRYVTIGDVCKGAVPWTNIKYRKLFIYRQLNIGIYRHTYIYRIRNTRSIVIVFRPDLLVVIQLGIVRVKVCELQARYEKPISYWGQFFRHTCYKTSRYLSIANHRTIQRFKNYISISF